MRPRRSGVAAGPVASVLPAQVDEPVDGADQDRPADDVAQRDRDQVADQAGDVERRVVAGDLVDRRPEARPARPPGSSIPAGMKYMFATECSKPIATKAAIGGTMARIRSVVVRAEYVSQTARQTRPLQRIPRTNAWSGP